MSPEYTEICGYTEEEIISYFPDYIKEMADEIHLDPEELILKMRAYYNGFTFDRTAKIRLYNPFSTLLFFRDRHFGNYWIDSGGSKLIADYMKERYLTVEQFRNFPVSSTFIANPGNMDTTPPEGFLYQSGYLTLREGDSDDFSLDYPNTEVRNAMSELVTQNMLQYRNESYGQCRSGLLSGLKTKNADHVIAAFNRLLAAIPYDDYSGAARQSISNYDYEMSMQECHYRTAIFTFLQGCGIVVAAEMHTNRGRADLVVSHRGNLWVIELKVAYDGESAETKAEEAYRQIIDRQYAAPYPGAVCLGLAIDDTLRQITASRFSESFICV
jgi:hypothetical protein